MNDSRQKRWQGYVTQWLFYVLIQILNVCVCNSLKSSINDDIKSLWKSTSYSMNVQDDSYKNTKQVIKVVLQHYTDKRQSQISS